MDGSPGDKLDLYSVPVFIFELVILAALSYSAYFLHFQYKHEPYLWGFYCDDVSLRHEYTESTLTKQFSQPDKELTVLALLLAVPITVIIFCELVNSMFGSLKFRRVRSLCKCCKLHSITRRTVRFAGAYALGFLFVVISCNLIANCVGHLRPSFAQECPQAFRDCPRASGGAISSAAAAAAATNSRPTSLQLDGSSGSSTGPLLEPNFANTLRPQSQPISSFSNANAGLANNTANILPVPARLVRSRRQALVSNSASGATRPIAVRQWIVLSGVDLADLCQFRGDSVQTRKFDRLAMSWPSFPAAIFTYAALYLATYLAFVGTARPFRMLTSCLVVLVLMVALIFDVQLVSDHYSHWEDVAAGVGLALAVVALVLVVYLNYFRDSHFYEKQRLPAARLSGLYLNDSQTSAQAHYNGYSNEIALEQFNLDKNDEQTASAPGGAAEPNGDARGSVSNNDLAMRYFQIPRANYRGAPRPLSNATNHMQ